MVSAESDVGITSQPVAARASDSRRSLAGMLTLVGAGAFAGALFGVSDVTRASANGWVGTSSAAAIVGLWIWFGQLLALAYGLVRAIAATIKRRLPSWLTWHAVVAMTAGALTLLLVRKVFSGAGVRNSSFAKVGEWLVPCAVTLGAWCALWVAARMTRARGTHQGVTILGAVSLSVLALVLDAKAPDGYLYLHVLLLAIALVLATQAAESFKSKRVTQASLIASIMTLPALVSFPSSVRARELLIEPSWAGSQLVLYAQLHIDLDRDGQSRVFGGGDCDDGDPTVFIGAPELPRDGRDSNCDGQDDPKSSSLRFAPFRLGTTERARSLAADAKRYPTVVILIDTLRSDRVGNPRFSNLAQLAKESLNYTQVYSVSATTLSSLPAMMTGRVRSSQAREHIAQVLAREHQTSAIVAPDAILAHLARSKLCDPRLGFTSRHSIPTDPGTYGGTRATIATSERLTAEAIALLDSASPPDLLFLHYFDVHQWDVLESEGLPPRGDVGRYDAVLDRLDASLRPLLDRRDRVTLILLGDHGEGLGARGVKHHGNFVFEELTHVPFLIRTPTGEPATVTTPVTSTGLFNTLRVLRGLEPDPSADASLLDLVGAKDAGDGPGFASFEQAQWGFIHGTHRLLYTPREQLLELYDLARDPNARVNIVRDEPQLASEMLVRLLELNNEPSQ